MSPADTRTGILFVDDEPAILDGLRRKFSIQDDHWDMHFAKDAASALDILNRQQIDVVVTDMRMPGMDGAELLDHVRQHHPAMARFVLSGFSEQEAVFRVLGPAHQYFAKPCEANTLVNAVERTMALRRRLRSPELQALISGATAVPIMPATLAHLLDQLQSPKGSIGEVARIVSSDIGLTTSVLKFVNSAYFFLPSMVSDIFQAVKMLGFELINSLAMLAGIFKSFHGDGTDLATVARLEETSLSIGLAARSIALAEKLSPALVNQCQCAGMLAHVGSLLLFANRSREMAEIQARLDESGGAIAALESERFGASHQEVGAYLLNLWGFGDGVVEAVLFHHRPSEAGNSDDHHLGPVAIVHAAQHLVKPRPAAAQLDPWLAELDLGYFERIGILEKLPDWIRETARPQTPQTP